MKMLKIKLIHKTIKQTQTIHRLMQKNWLNVLNHSVGSSLKGLKARNILIFVENLFEEYVGNKAKG